jgi:hypothetical protein
VNVDKEQFAKDKYQTLYDVVQKAEQTKQELPEHLPICRAL